MNIIYCNVGEMNEYNGIANDSIHGGGAYNNDNIGHEVNNFTNHNGTYYGFVQASSDTIDISSNFGAPKNAEYIDDILVIWMIKNKTVVGYYKDARVFRKLHITPNNVTANRTYDEYNIMTTHAVLIPKAQRSFSVLNHTSRSNVWYGNDENNERVVKFVEQYEASLNDKIGLIDDFSETLIGIEKDAIVKQRINQSFFRELMLKKFNCKCALCGIDKQELLIASHIKPWSKSDCNEKISSYNGLLLCPNHDKLFDQGYISFEDNGNIIISKALSDNNRMFFNIDIYRRLNQNILSEQMKYFLSYHRNNIFKK